MKKTLSLLLLTGAVALHAQHDVVPQPFPALSLSTPLNGLWSTDVTHAGPVVAPTSGTLTIAPTANVTFTSGQGVHLLPGFHAAPSGNGSFHAQIANVYDELALFTPANVGSQLDVEQYEKLEYGVKLPHDVMDAINNFRAGIGTPQLNPFDPTQLVMTVTYKHYASQNAAAPDAAYEGFGFYYEEYDQDPGSNIPINTWSAISINTNYNIRYRFAPPSFGLWKAEVSLSSVSLNYSRIFEFWFNCVAPADPENKGFVTRTAGEHYFRLGGQTWMPIGQNLGWPYIDFQPTNPYPIDDYALVQQRPTDRHRFFVNRMQAIKNGGANFFRTILFPSATDLEFDTAGYYFGHMYNAWEVDRMLDEARDMHLYIELNLLLHYQLMNPGPYDLNFWDWTGTYPCGQHPGEDRPSGYANLVQNPNDPTQFLTDPVAMETFKWKLQYIAARWGYSRQIAVFQLVSEINAVGTVQNYDCTTGHDAGSAALIPYNSDYQVQAAVNNWHNSMLHFMKHDLELPQLLSISYAYIPGPNDHSFDSPDLDIRDFNDYPFGGVDYPYRAINDYLTFSQGQSGVRPVVLSETGSAFSPNTLCIEMEWIRALWIIPFSGQASGALNYTDEPGFYPMFQVLRDFIGAEDLNAGWEPQHTLKPNPTGDSKAEAIYLQNETEGRAMGTIVNRSYNGYTYGCPNQPVPASPNNVHTALNGYSDINYLFCSFPSFPNTAFVEDFYNVIDGSPVSSWGPVYTDASGNLVLYFPLLNTISNSNPLVAFKVRALPAGRVANPHLADSLVSLQVSIAPNPSDGRFNLTVPSELVNSNYVIKDATGRDLYNGVVQTASSEINTEMLANGLYFLYISNKEYLISKEILIIK